MGNIEKAHFGKVAAEHDYMLKEAFTITPEITKCHESEVSFIVGRKGAGKSAVVEHLSSKHKNEYNHIIIFNPRDLRYSDLKILYDINAHYRDANPIALMEYVWKNVIFAKLMQNIITSKTYTPIKEEPMYTFITDHFGVDKSFLGKFLKTAQQCLKDTKGVHKITSNITSICGGSDFEISFSNAILALNKYLANGKKALILIDNVDEHWNASQASYDFIHALVHAVRAINNREICNNIFVKCFIPTDISKGLETRHSDKVTEDQHELLWGRETLLAMVGTRIALSLNIKGSDGDYSKNYSYCWEQLFEKSGNNLIGRKENSFDYILRHTLYRPRDILRVCKYLKGKALAEGYTDKIPFRILTTYLPTFCEDSIDYLQDEYSSRLDQILDIISEFTGHENILEYEIFIETVKGAIIANNLTISERNMEKLLYEIGFIGGMRSSYYSNTDPVIFRSPTYNFKFSFNKSRYNLKTAQKICIHPMFYELLSIIPHPQIIVQGH